MEEMAGEGEKGRGEKCWKEREGLEMEEIAGKGEKGWRGREVLREGRSTGEGWIPLKRKRSVGKKGIGD